jgi:hypothetical protein
LTGPAAQAVDRVTAFHTGFVRPDLADALTDLDHDSLLGQVGDEAASGVWRRPREMSNRLDIQNPKTICGRCSGPAN